MYFHIKMTVVPAKCFKNTPEKALNLFSTLIGTNTGTTSTGMTIFKQVHFEISLALLYFRDFFGGGVPQV